MARRGRHTAAPALMGCAIVLAGALAAARASAAASAPCPAAVRVSLPNFEVAPYVLGTDRVESPPGLLIEWTRQAIDAAAAALGPACKPAVTVQRRPPNRQLVEAAQGALDILPGFGYAADNGGTLVFPMAKGKVDASRAFMADYVSLYTRADAGAVRWDGTSLRHPRQVVGSSTGGVATTDVARQYGWRMESAPTPRADLDKLLAGRVDVILEPDVVMTPYLTGDVGTRVRKLSPPARTTLRYAPVRKDFAERYPAFTERFWLELCIAAGRCRPAK